jgi:hypothetical protein
MLSLRGFVMRRHEATECPKIPPIGLKINIFHNFRAPFLSYPIDLSADIVTVEWLGRPYGAVQPCNHESY